MSNLDKHFDRNLKLMSMSAGILVILVGYVFYKSEASITGPSYFLGLGFLFVLFIIALVLRIYKDKIIKAMPKSKFAQTLEENEKQKEKSQKKELSKENSTSSSKPEEMISNIEAVKSDITFDDIAGISEIKGELEEVVDFLNNPQKYLKYDVKLPKGVLLVGPPGVGKTLIARAVAGEANVPFFYQSGASFVHIYVGMGAKRVKELFMKAKVMAPAIVFIDEIDAIGKERSGNSNEERESTLNELLTQMDGFDGHSGVIVVAATNKIEVLDEALLRAGRFDRRVFLNLPNLQDRKKILELYLKRREYSFDLDTLAHETTKFSSAALATLINEAVLNMIKRDDCVISQDDIEMAKQKVEFGKKENQILNQAQKKILSIYQSSKAYITKEGVSLFEEGIKKDDIVYPSKSELIFSMKKYLAGSIGVEVLKGEPYAINPKDLEEAEKIALNMVSQYKMSKDSEELLDFVKNELRAELSKNIDEILRLQKIILDNEIILERDLNNE